MKAILVIDMPTDCASGCPVMCRARGINHRPTWCPLKPLPQKKSHIEGSWNAEKNETTNDFENGWNACLEEIRGEE